jgi:large subunit ribosomal protein L4
MRLKVCSRDLSSCSDSDVAELEGLEGNRGVVALKQCLVGFMANLRQGNACAKDRGDVSGSGKKPYRQKGTGMARQGSKRSPIWAGGGVVFGPRPRDYSQKINKKIKCLALLRALTDKANEGNLFVVDELTFGEPKTKAFSLMLKRAFSHESVLFVDENFEETFVLAAGNIGRVFMVDSQSLNAFDVVRYQNVVMSRSAVSVVASRLSGKGSEIA